MAEPIDFIEPCPLCDGRRPDCEDCHGENRVPFFRCPNKMATAREFDALRAALLVMESGVLPDEGGWTDQPHTFVQAFPIAKRELVHWQHEAEKAAIAEAGKK